MNLCQNFDCVSKFQSFNQIAFVYFVYRFKNIIENKKELKKERELLKQTS